MKTPKCLIKYLIGTSKGNRNSNMFNAINHVRRFNPKSDYNELYRIALVLNQELSSPLQKGEVETLTKHVLKQEYKSSCKKYQKYCAGYPCNCYHKHFNQLGEAWWKYVDHENKLKNIPGVKGKEVYPWEILDTSKLSQDQVDDIWKLRMSKGINPRIDVVLKLKGIPIGDEAYEIWNNNWINEE